jgi:hypothetical protein
MTSDARQLGRIAPSEYLHVMVTNFTHEEVVLPKSTAVGVAEEIPEALVATLITETNPTVETVNRLSVRTTPRLEPMLRLLTTAERRVIEPILQKYRRVFHDETCNDFKGTDLVKHRIITGDAKPIRKNHFAPRMHSVPK